MAVPSTLTYFVADYPRTLFPLQTNAIVISRCSDLLDEHIYQRILAPGSDNHHAFLPQQTVFSAKARWHLRKTVKLDPVAEYFIYDLTFRNRHCFRRPFQQHRRSFGYRFDKGLPIPVDEAYKAFRLAAEELRVRFKYALRFDIASYFNSIYHHDLFHWFEASGATAEDAQSLGRFLREINVGRSIDCLPQGLYPTKLMGSHFLTDVDNSVLLKSAQMIRFMDDYILFDDRIDTLVADFIRVQKLLGERGLSVNPAKTRLPKAFSGSETMPGGPRTSGNPFGGLFDENALIFVSDDVGDLSHGQESVFASLSAERVTELRQKVFLPDCEDWEASLLLSYFAANPSAFPPFMHQYLVHFPRLTKRIHHIASLVEDKSGMADSILRFLRDATLVSEEQVYWLSSIVENCLLRTSAANELLVSLLAASEGSAIATAKVLEIPENRFGMQDIREQYLRTGHSNWLGWAAAVGSRKQSRSGRNHLLKYFAKCSPINHIVAHCVMGIEN